MDSCASRAVGRFFEADQFCGEDEECVSSVFGYIRREWDEEKNIRSLVEGEEILRPQTLTYLIVPKHHTSKSPCGRIFMFFISCLKIK